MKILVLNAGSSSLKYKLYVDRSVIDSGVIECIEDYRDGIMEVQDRLRRVGINGFGALDVVGHRVVHGGEAFKDSVIVDSHVIEKIKSLIPLAPLHNPANLEGIQVVQKLAPLLKQVAVFDTAFHQSIPKESYIYALPYEMYDKHAIRRYGFHGTSHQYVAKEAAKLLQKESNEVNLITLHLGNGASACAIRGGKSVDTSMGFTPLEGLVMGTRSGDIDSAILLYLARELDYTPEQIDVMLNKSSGLVGICGESDMRKIHQMIGNGDRKAKLALEMFVYRIKKYIGAYYAILGKVDAIVFTGGIGENDDIVRKMVLDGLPFASSVFVIRTDEELEIATQCEEVLTKS